MIIGYAVQVWLVLSPKTLSPCVTSRATHNEKDQEEAGREMPETRDTQMEEAAEKDWLRDYRL